MRSTCCSLLLSLAFLAACQAAPLDTINPSATPPPSWTPSPTRSPNPSPTKPPEPIDSSNLDRLQLTDFSDLGFEYPLVYQRAKFDLPPLVDPGRYVARQSQNNWGVARWSPDGEFLVVETSRGIDVLNGNDLSFFAEYDNLTPIDMLSDGNVAAISEGQIVSLNIRSGGTTVMMPVADPDASMAVSPDGSHLAYATGPQTFELVNLESGEARAFKITRSYAPVSISDFSFMPDSSVLFVTTPITEGADVITLFEVESGRRMYEMPAAYPVVHAAGTNYYAYWDKSQGIGSGYLARPANDGSAQVVQASFPALLRYRTDTANMTYDSYAMSFQSDTNTLGVLYVGNATVGGKVNGMVYVWDLETIQTRSIFDLGYPYPFEFAFSPDGTRFFSASFDGAIRLWDGASGQVVASNTRYSFFWPASLSPDGMKMTVPYYNHFDVVDVASQTVLNTVRYPEFRRYPHGPTAPYDSRVTFLSDGLISFWVGHQAASPSIFYSLRQAYTYDTNLDRIVAQFEHGRAWDSYYNCKYSEDGSRQVCQCTNSGEIEFIDVAEVRTGTSLLKLRANHIDRYAISHDGQLLAYCKSGSNNISIASTAGSGVRQINYPCGDMLFLPGPDLLLLSDGQVVNIQDKVTVGQFEFQSAFENFPPVFFRADRNYVLIGNRFFDLQTGRLLGSLSTLSSINDVAAVQDDLTLIVLTAMGVEYWQVK